MNRVVLINTSNVIKQGDTKNNFKYRLVNADTSQPVNLTNTSVIVVISLKGSPFITKPVIITEPLGGTVEFGLEEEEYTEVGDFDLEFVVTYSDGEVEYFPSSQNLKIKIFPHLKRVIPNTEIPLDVTDFSVGTPTDTSIPVSWTISTSTDIDHYEISYSTDGENFALANTDIGATLFSYVVSGLAKGTTYTIKIVSVDVSGLKSNGVTVTATTTGASSSGDIDGGTFTDPSTQIADGGGF